VIALMFIVGVFVAPIGVSFYHTQLLNEVSDGLVSALRQAQSFALTGKSVSAYGVRVQDNRFVMFIGDSYNSRIIEEDTVGPAVPSVSISGPEEIVFERFTGEPSTAGTYHITLGDRERQVFVLSSGNVSR